MLRLREDRTRAAKSVDSLILQKLLVHLSSSKCLPGITLGSTLLPHKSLLSVYQARFLHSECFCTENWNVQVKHKSTFSCAPAGVAFWGMRRRICLSWQEVVKKEDWVKEQGRKSWATAPPRRARCTVGKVHCFPRPRILWGFVLPHRMQETLCLNQCLQKTCISGLGCRKLLQAEWIHIEFPLTWFQGPCSVSEGLDVFMIMSHNRLRFSFTCVSFCLGLLWCFLNSTLMSQHLTPIHAELVIRHLKKVVCIYSVHVQAQWCHCCYWLVWIYCVCVSQWFRFPPC